MNRILTTKGWLVLLLVVSLLGLLVFIFIGFFQTQKTDEPISEENIPPVVIEEIAEEEPVSEVCFAYNHEPTETEPYEVSEKIVIKIDGDKVSGSKTGTQNGPDMTNGYEGTLEGDKISDTLELIYSYTIEGSEGKEKEIYKISGENLLKQRYSLIEEEGILVPDKESELKVLTYEKQGCEEEILPLETDPQEISEN